MSGLAATVLIPQLFEPADTSRVTSLLGTLFDEVQETRKGRHWNLSVCNHAASLSVVSTVDNLDEYEDDLLAANCLPADMPEAFQILFGCSDKIDRLTCEKLREVLVRAFDGVDCESQG